MTKTIKARKTKTTGEELKKRKAAARKGQKTIANKNTKASEERQRRIQYAIEEAKKAQKKQDAHCRRMKAKRKEVAERKQEIIDSGSDIVLCYDCRMGMPHLFSDNLVAEPRPKAPKTEIAAAKAEGRFDESFGHVRFEVHAPVQSRPQCWMGDGITDRHLESLGPLVSADK